MEDGLSRTVEIRGATEEAIQLGAEHAVTAALRLDAGAGRIANVTSVTRSRLPYAEDGNEMLGRNTTLTCVT